MARLPLPPLVIGECSPLCLSTMDEAMTEEATMAEVTNEQQTNAEVPDATTFTLYIPEFLSFLSFSWPSSVVSR
jgi:hypothetical protein